MTVLGKGTLGRENNVFIGWSFTKNDRIKSEQELENAGLKKVGETFPITADTTLFAVWAQDDNNNGRPDYDEVIIKWHPGVMLNKAGGIKEEPVSKKEPVTFTTQGYTMRGYVLIGWARRRFPVLRNKAAESRVQPLRKVGDTLTVKENDMFYAVWAIDADNNGRPDYNNADPSLQTRRASLLRGSAEGQDKASFEATEVRVWAHEGTLYIESDRQTRADIYTRSGALYQRINVAEGQTSQPLAAGFYIVAIDGKRYKVLVK